MRDDTYLIAFWPLLLGPRRVISRTSTAPGALQHTAVPVEMFLIGQGQTVPIGRATRPIGLPLGGTYIGGASVGEVHHL